MTLDTKTTLTAAVEEMLKHRTLVGIMASDAIHRHTVAWIDGRLTHRVRKTFVLIVTVITNVPTVFQHRRAIAAMSKMAIGAAIPVLMLMQHLISFIKGIRMAPPADTPLIGW